MKLSDMTEVRFGHLVGVKRVATTIGKHPVWLWRCDCGSYKELTSEAVKRKKYDSCGCQDNGRHRFHGFSKTRTYRVWLGLCARPYVRSVEKVCPRWKNSFINFLVDMGECPDGMSIDRIDNEKGYSLDNCRWATPTEQARNRRSNVVVEFAGQKLCLMAACEMAGVSYNTVQVRRRRGADAQSALDRG